MTFIDEQALMHLWLYMISYGIAIAYTSISAIYKHIHSHRSEKSNGNKNNKKHFQ